ncbi:hypothetical protein [Georgenia sp. SUBG003]|uniref:hypothetical protein n=1 Tax=Georgenia sp. SUBG003 TaxID=1497974 RepID=UPI003AB15012
MAGASCLVDAVRGQQLAEEAPSAAGERVEEVVVERTELWCRGDRRQVRDRVGRQQADQTVERPVPWQAAPDLDERDLAATFPRMRGRKGFGQVLVNLRELFLGTAPAQTTDLLAAHEERPWDLIAGDPMALGTRFAAERLRSRWATVSPIAVWLPGRGIPPTGLGLLPARGARAGYGTRCSVRSRARDGGADPSVPRHPSQGRSRPRPRDLRDAAGVPDPAVAERSVRT